MCVDARMPWTQEARERLLHMDVPMPWAQEARERPCARVELDKVRLILQGASTQ